MIVGAGIREKIRKSIVLIWNMMEKIYRNEMESAWPFSGRSIYGGSFWMRKK